MKNLAFARLALLLALTLLLTGCNLGAKVEEEAEVEVEAKTAANEAVAQPKEETVVETKPAVETKIEAGTKIETEAKAEVSIEPRVIAVSGDEYSFSPSSITVNKEEKIKVVFTNVGQSRHNWVIGGLNLSTRTIGSNETDTLEFTADDAGTYEIFCSIAGHKEAGMVGSLTVK